MYSSVIIALACLGIAAADGVSQPTPAAQPTVAAQSPYQPQDPVTSYVAHATYPYNDAYGPAPSYEGYLAPSVGPQYPAPEGNYATSIVPTAQGYLRTALKVLAKTGLFLIGGVALLIVGGIFTTAVCSLTPLCTISFAGFGKLDKATVRSYMTPEGVANAAALVEDAVQKYQRLQRTVSKL